MMTVQDGRCVQLRPTWLEAGRSARGPGTGVAPAERGLCTMVCQVL